MCGGCWEERGAPKIVTETTRRIRDEIEAVYNHSLTGGNAHIVVDDWNLETDDIQWCLDNMEGGDPEQLADERKCLNSLLAVSMDERASALALWDEWFTE